MYVCLNRGTTGGGLGLEDFARLAATAGFQGADVDLDYGAERGTTALSDLFAGLNLRFGGWGPPVDHRTEQSKRGAGMEKLGRFAKIARELKIDSCATYILPSSDLRFMENWRLHVDGLKPVARMLAEQGLRFGLEFIGPYHHRRQHPHEFIYSPGLMLELADAVGPNVGLLVDCWHCHTAGVTWKHLSEIPGDKIVLCHLNDAPNLPLAELQDFTRLLPGDGVIDLPGFFAALKATGYDGPVSLESFSAVKDLPAPEAARRAWAAARKVLTAAGMA